MDGVSYPQEVRMLFMLAEVYFLLSLGGIMSVLAWRSKKASYFTLAVQVTCWVQQLDFLRWMMAAPDERSPRELLLGLYPSLPTIINIVICCLPALVAISHLVFLFIERLQFHRQVDEPVEVDEARTIKLTVFRPQETDRAA